MVYYLKNWGVQDAANINPCDDLEFKEWAAKFSVKAEVLKQAFDAVGSKINNLRKYLHEKQFIVAT